MQEHSKAERCASIWQAADFDEGRHGVLQSPDEGFLIYNEIVFDPVQFDSK